MKFSIIVPTYNRGYIIDNLLRSLVSQTYNNWEAIIIDDGSTDNTKQVVDWFHEDRFILKKQSNQGPSAARNKALDIANGEWILYIDSDNELLSNCLDVLVSQITKKPGSKVIVSKGIRTLELYKGDRMIDCKDDSMNYPVKVTVQDIYTRKVKFDINGFAHHREIIEKGYKWDETMLLMEDWDFFMQFGSDYQDAFLYNQIPIFHYHQRFGTDGLVSNAEYIDWANAFEKIYLKHKDNPLMDQQDWYPGRVDKYTKLAEDEKAGKAAPAYLKYFPDHR
jgi:glycosyltransferase involved in cell wall biosynthesis